VRCPDAVGGFSDHRVAQRLDGGEHLAVHIDPQLLGLRRRQPGPHHAAAQDPRPGRGPADRHPHEHPDPQKPSAASKPTSPEESSTRALTPSQACTPQARSQVSVAEASTATARWKAPSSEAASSQAAKPAGLQQPKRPDPRGARIGRSPIPCTRAGGHRTACGRPVSACFGQPALTRFTERLECASRSSRLAREGRATPSGPGCSRNSRRSRGHGAAICRTSERHFRLPGSGLGRGNHR
jgi:hypothetical protein